MKTPPLLTPRSGITDLRPQCVKPPEVGAPEGEVGTCGSGGFDDRTTKSVDGEVGDEGFNVLADRKSVV